MTGRRGARRLLGVATLAFALGAAAGCAAEAPIESLQVPTATPAPTVTPPPTATPAPAPTVDFPMPVEKQKPEPEPEPEPASDPAPASAATSTQAGIEDRIFALANEARAAAGVGQLKRRGGLDDVARAWSKHLASGSRDLAHNPSYSSEIPGGWSSAAENVAWLDDGGQYSRDKVAQTIHQGWMDSSGHRANLLNPDFTHLGVGVVEGPNGYYFTQNFAAY